MKYRAEIDGLRALAVVPVILFHAGFELFSGGFVGVDVFFVISGYLITTILIEDLENQRFSLVSFYERRARRILPALFFVMFVCIPFAWMWMLPRDLLDFSQSLVAVSLFASNILFWKESGYFGADSELKPLLHTWSLAVEEQYYVLFPIFLILAWRFGRNRVFWMIVVMAAISLLLSEWGWRNKATANFYLAPTRAWELFAGSIAAFIVQKRGVQKNNPLATLGLAAIVFSIFFYDETTPFPSVYALAPVLGVVLLVLYADKATFAAKLLSMRGFVGIGLISYSAYLWHQPIISFYKYRFETSVFGFIFAVALSFFVAFFSWKFIEKPFRNPNWITKSRLFLLSVSFASIFITVGLAGHTNFNNSLILIRNDPYDGQLARRLVSKENQFYKVEGNNFILWGDSFADALSYPLKDILLDSNIGFTSYIKHSCPSLLGVVRNENKRLGVNFAPSCIEFNENLKNELSKEDHRNKYLVITSAYAWYSSGLNDVGESILLPKETMANHDTVGASLRNTVIWANSVGLNPIVVLAPPKFPSLKDKIRQGTEVAKVIEVELSEVVSLNARLTEILEDTNAMIIDPVPILCGANKASCLAFNEDKEKFITWYDGSHLSEFGGKEVSAYIRDIIARDTR